MNCHGGSGNGRVKTNDGSIILVGNDNVGKSVFFGWLTGTYVTVANYPGTTVEITRGVAQCDGHHGVIDTPGVNSLQPISDDERVTREVLFTESPFVVLQVADAKNLRRALLLTSQLAEMEVPLVVALNMMDETQARGIRVNVAALRRALGVAVVPTTATESKGFAELTRAIEEPAPVRPRVHFGDDVEQAIRDIVQELDHRSARAQALLFLSGEAGMEDWIRSRVDSARMKKFVACAPRCVRLSLSL